MLLKSDKIPALPKSSSAAPWPTFVISLDERKALGNGMQPYIDEGPIERVLAATSALSGATFADGANGASNKSSQLSPKRSYPPVSKPLRRGLPLPTSSPRGSVRSFPPNTPLSPVPPPVGAGPVRSYSPGARLSGLTQSLTDAEKRVRRDGKISLTTAIIAAAVLLCSYLVLPGWRAFWLLAEVSALVTSFFFSRRALQMTFLMTTSIKIIVWGAGGMALLVIISQIILMFFHP